MATLFTAEGYLDVYAQFDADLYCGLSGGGILQVGSRMASSIPDANVVRIGDGVMVTSEGRAIIITAGSYDDFDIPVGAAGVTAYYVIGYRLYSGQDNIRVAEQFVYTASSATDLPASSGTLREGATEVYVPVYRVRQEGLTITSVTALVDTLYPLSYFKTVLESLSSQNASLTALINNHFVQPGTRVDGTAWVTGTITNSGKDIMFNLPLTKPLAPAIRTVQVVGMYAKVRQGNKYLWGTAAARKDVDPEEVTAYKADYGVNIVWSHRTALSGALNNDVVGIDVEARLRFTT